MKPSDFPGLSVTLRGLMLSTETQVKSGTSQSKSGTFFTQITVYSRRPFEVRCWMAVVSFVSWPRDVKCALQGYLAHKKQPFPRTLR